jgi:S-DNA-T family DNA segregation ATPase FtsK/SpoIIIE
MGVEASRVMAKRRRKTRARRSSAWPVALRLPALEQRQLDLIGLGLVALGVFLASVLYFGWAGGKVGAGMADGLRSAFGAVAYIVPVAVVAAGAILVLRPVLPTTRPFLPGALCLFAALTLALAAGTLGLGPPGVRHGFWHQAWFESRGGGLGEAELWLTSTLLGTVGAHIVAIFLFLAGVLLLTGATIAGVMRNLRRHATTTATAIHRRAATLHPPEPQDKAIVVRSMADPKPPPGPELDAEERYPDLFGPTAASEPEPEPEPEEAEVVEEPPEPEPLTPNALTPNASELTPQGRYRNATTDDPDFPWRLPNPGVLVRSQGESAKPDTAGQERISAQLVEALSHFGVQAKIVGTVAGPHITRYELRLAPGIKVSKVAQLKDDLAYALAATDIRILAPIPGKTAVGVEVPNMRRRIVHLGDVYADPPSEASPMYVWLGKDVAGRAVGADLARMPHLLVAGTTGSGKSGCINAMLSSILLRASPHEVRLVLVDPKQVELNHYDSIPHLLTPVITSPRMASNALQNLVREMEQRYGLMSLARTRSLPELNRAREERDEPPLPYVVCVIDELADLMMVAPADVEDAVIRLAQKARAVGIHLVLATQSPRVDVITGMIKANVPSRIAFAVSSQTDSRVILDQNGAESLLGQGDMLYSPVGTSRLQRIQGAYIDEAQIAELTEHWRAQGEPELQEELLDEVADKDAAGPAGEDDFDPDEDPLLEDAITLVAEMQTASTSMLQRRLRLGYTRAGRLIDMLERRGVISGYEGSKPRSVLITEADLPRILDALRDGARGVPERPDPMEEQAVSESVEDR